VVVKVVPSFITRRIFKDIFIIITGPGVISLERIDSINYRSFVS
jgi:hypothetical protein